MRCSPILNIQQDSTSMYAGARDVPPGTDVPETAGRVIHGRKNPSPLHSVHAYAPVAA